MGNLTQALDDVDRAIAIYKRSGASDEPDHFARVLELRGLLEARRGNLAAARASLSQALNERTRIFGESHPLVAETRSRLAAVDLAGGNPRAALAGALEAERLGRDHLLFTVRYLPERQAITYAAKRPRGLDLALTIARESGIDPTAVFDAVIRSRGVILDEFAAAHRRAATSSDPEVISDDSRNSVAATFRESRREEPAGPGFSDLAGRGPQGEGRGRERALAERNVEARAELSRVSVGLDEVRKALPSDTALVLVRAGTRERALSKRASQSVVRFPRPHTQRSLVQSGRPVTLVPLGSAVDDAHIRSWRKQASGQSIAAGVSSTRADRSYLAASIRLRRTRLGSVGPVVVGASRIFVVPDGLLNLVNLAALPDGDGYLVERSPVIHYLTTERDVLLPVRDAGAPRGFSQWEG